MGKAGKKRKGEGRGGEGEGEGEKRAPPPPPPWDLPLNPVTGACPILKCLTQAIVSPM